MRVDRAAGALCVSGGAAMGFAYVGHISPAGSMEQYVCAAFAFVCVLATTVCLAVTLHDFLGGQR